VAAKGHMSGHFFKLITILDSGIVQDLIVLPRAGALSFLCQKRKKHALFSLFFPKT
jgi:hypothetical protein